LRSFILVSTETAVTGCLNNSKTSAYKITEYFFALTNGNLDDSGKTIVRCKILNIEKYLNEWVKKHTNSGVTFAAGNNIANALCAVSLLMLTFYLIFSGQGTIHPLDKKFGKLYIYLRY